MFLVIREYQKQTNVVSEPVVESILNLPVYQLAGRPRIVGLSALEHGNEHYFIEVPRGVAREGELDDDDLVDQTMLLEVNWGLSYM